MLNNNIRFALRNIFRNKVYSAINVLGLTLGLSACIVAYLVINYDLSFDTFHPDKDRIYRVVTQWSESDGRMITNSGMPPVVPELIGREISGIEKVCGLFPYSAEISVPEGEHRDIKFGGDLEGDNVSTIITGTDYFDIFQHRWLAGTPSSFEAPFTIVISESTAAQYFGQIPLTNVIGKEIVYNDSLHLTVAGVVADWSGNTDFPFTSFISLSTVRNSFLKSIIPLDGGPHSNSSSPNVFIKVSPGTLPDDIHQQLQGLVARHRTDKVTYVLQPLTQIHFTEDANYGDGEFHVDGDHFRKAHLPTLYSLAGGALLILFVAIVNFVILFSTQSMRRLKEMGIRKTLGGMRAGLTRQILSETLVLTIISASIAILLIDPILSVLAEFLPNGLNAGIINFKTVFFLLAVIGTTTLLTGFYPARMLASCSPAMSLKGIVGTPGKSKNLRRGMILFQFTLSGIFMIAAIVMNKQLRFMQAGTRLTQAPIITVKAGDKAALFADKVRQLEGVSDAAVQGTSPIGLSRMITNVQNKNRSESPTRASIKMGDEHFIPLYEMRILAGRNLTTSDSLREFVINQTYCKTLGVSTPEEALGELIYYEGKPYPIVGVVEDFHEGSFHEPIGPVAIGIFPRWQQKVAIKLSVDHHQLAAALPKIEAQWKKYFPNDLFEYTFLEDESSVLYKKEANTGFLLNGIMIITIFISCMGVFGLAMFNARIRTKEIGIRKVLGAKVTSIIVLLSREFVMLVLLGILIASPIAWYFMNEWLSDFAYRVPIAWWTYVLAGIIALAVALLAGGSQALKAALANPVKSLRSE